MTLRFLGKQKVKSVCTKRDVEALTLGPVLDVQSEKKTYGSTQIFLSYETHVGMFGEGCSLASRGVCW